MLYMVTFTINIPPMLAYIPAPWILWVMETPQYWAMSSQPHAVIQGVACSLSPPRGGASGAQARSSSARSHAEAGAEGFIGGHHPQSHLGFLEI